MKQPSAIIIARHGVRLDQNDKNWRANNADPYDSPLSYGGWIQCQTLGARIDKELQYLEAQRAQQDAGSYDLDFARPPRKKRRIVLHSSPFRRCIQTSIAIAAGLKYPPVERLRPVQTPAPRSSLSQSQLNTDHLPELMRQSSREDPPASSPNGVKPRNDERYQLKVDPFLGEWLSPSYFEEIEPPPPSDVMMQKAKAYHNMIEDRIRGATMDAFSAISELEADREEEIIAQKPLSGLRAMAMAGHSMPHRASTTSFDVKNGSKGRVQKLRQRARASTYSPPLPQYSLAPQDPIPLGFVPHARDACINWQMDWDSAKLGWGDGGAYPEEWSAMHIRFRHGLQHLLNFYEDAEKEEIDQTMKDGSSQEGNEDDDEEDEDEDLVLVLVTHQAGANALIRLLTGAPALHDIGTASLTLAVRREGSGRKPSISRTSLSHLENGDGMSARKRRGSLDWGFADNWEMRVIASTEHLKFGSNPLGLNSPRLGRSPAMSSRRLVGADSIDGFSIGDPLSYRQNSSNGDARARREINDSLVRPVVNTGLWGSPAVLAISTTLDADELEPMSPRSRPQTPKPDPELIELKLSSPSRISSNTLQTMETATSNDDGLWSASSTLQTNGLWSPTASADFRIRDHDPAMRRWSAISTLS